MALFHGRGSTASRLQSHFEEAVYFLPCKFILPLLRGGSLFFTTIFYLLIKTNCQTVQLTNYRAKNIRSLASYI